MTWAWVSLWIAVGVAVVGSFLAGLAEDGRVTDLETRWYAVRFATTALEGGGAAALLLLVVLAFTGSGAVALLARVTGAARDAADAGVARTCESSVSNDERWPNG